MNPRKPSKKTLKNKLDKEISRIVRARGKCAKCGKEEYEKLQAAHIFSRSNLSTRWDLDNLLCLCGGCHLFWAHKNPVEFTEFVRNYLGEYKYERLRQNATSIKKWTIEDLQIMLEVLKTTR